MNVNLDTIKFETNDQRISVVGLGYVGLPLAIEFAKQYPVIGYDINPKRIKDLNRGIDQTKEADLLDLKNVLNHEGERKLIFTHNANDIKTCNIFIVTVPTPINEYNSPDLEPLISATSTIGKVLKRGDIVIYESTVYPGCTEDECVPVLESMSGLKFNIDFFVGYSPERINPGDKVNTLTNIVKVTSGSTEAIANRVDLLYRSIIKAGTYKAPSIKVAEAAKAIENAQRDVNISFVNELAFIFDKIGIDTNDVIDAASTKWNFLKFKPGLVGGHCIGVDPYYLAFKAQSLGYHPQVILSGRRVNDKMGSFVAEKVVKLMIQKDHKIKGSKALIMGVTFKENCPDIRNTRVIDIYHELKSYGLSVDVYDPWACKSEVMDKFGLEILNEVDDDVVYNAVIVAIAHNEFKEFDFYKIKENNGVVFDTKAFIDRNLVDGRL